MAILRIKDENDNFIEIPAIKGTDGKDGKDGIDGKDGTSITVVQATDENNAISLSTQHPNNIYYWEE